MRGPLITSAYRGAISSRSWAAVSWFSACSTALSPRQEAGRTGRRPGEALPQEISAWLHVNENGEVTVYTGKVEVGQNIRTSLTQAVAEELSVAPGSVHLLMGDTDRVPFDMGTFGSRTTPTMSPQLRRAASAAREALIGLAAEAWHVDRAKLRGGQRRGHGPGIAANRKLWGIGQGARDLPRPFPPKTLLPPPPSGRSWASRSPR